MARCTSAAIAVVVSSLGCEPVTFETLQTSEPAAHPEQERRVVSAVASEPPEAIDLVAKLNAWCKTRGDECVLAEEPARVRPRVARADTVTRIHGDRERLSSMGVELAWDGAQTRFLTRAEDDVRKAIGAAFTPERLGADSYEAIVGRLRRRPYLYANVLERVVGTAPDAGWLSSSQGAHLLELLAEVAPDAAAASARRLQPVYDSALQDATPPPANDPDRAKRLRDQLDVLDRLARQASAPSK